MPNEAAAPAGSCKYFLIQPDTFDLLVKNFEEVQQFKNKPAVKLALEFEKKILHINGNEAAMRELLIQNAQELCALYKICGRAQPLPPPQQQDPPAAATAAATVSSSVVEKRRQLPEIECVNNKKIKWVSFRK